MTSAPEPEPGPGPALTTYYWRSGFALLAPSFVLDRRARPYRRLSATLMIATRSHFLLETGEGECRRARAVLIPPKVLRRRILAQDADIAIFDMAIATAEYMAIHRALAEPMAAGQVLELDPCIFAPFTPDLAAASSGSLDCGDLRQLLYRLIFAVSGQWPRAAQLQPRIVKVLRQIQSRPLNAMPLAEIAEQAHLSPSRLRHLFREQTGCSLTHYMRWNAVWKGVWLWARGTPMIEVAEAAGFHDLAHLNRAFNEVFGMNPSAVADPARVRLIRCEWDLAD